MILIHNHHNHHNHHNQHKRRKNEDEGLEEEAKIKERRNREKKKRKKKEKEKNTFLCTTMYNLNGPILKQLQISFNYLRVVNFLCTLNLTV